MEPSKSENILKIVQNAIESLISNLSKLSEIIRDCIRIARLRNDFLNLLWLQREIINNENSFVRTRAFTEIQMHFSEEEFNKHNAMFLEKWMKERPAIDVNPDGVIVYPQDKVLLRSVSDIELELDELRKAYQNTNTPVGMHPFDTYMVDKSNLKLRPIFHAKIIHYEKILENIKNRVYDFMSLTEKNCYMDNSTLTILSRIAFMLKNV